MKRKRLKRNILAALVGLLLGGVAIPLVLGCFVFSAPRYHGPVSDHFDGKRFINLTGKLHRSGGVWKWMFHRHRGPWPEWVDSKPGPPPPERVGKGDLRVTFINHATVLLQMDGLNILTDPIWSKRCSPLSWIGPKRHRAPGIRFDDLPPIDDVLVSHNHYDHLDVPTLRRLAAKFHPRIYSGLGNKLLFDKKGIPNATDMDWWDETDLGNGVRLTFVPSQHFSGRGLCDRNCTLWGSFVIQGPGGNVYFAGDTGFGPQFQEIEKRFGPFRLAVLPIGAYLPQWFMGPVHLSPPQAVEASRILKAVVSVPIHYGTFQIADDGYDQPLTELRKAVKEENLTIVESGSNWRAEEKAKGGEGLDRTDEVGLASQTSPTSRTGQMDHAKAPSGVNSPEAVPAVSEPSSSSRPQFWILHFGEGRDVPALSSTRARTAEVNPHR